MAYAEDQDPKFKLEKTHDEVEAGKERQEVGKREAADEAGDRSRDQAVDVDSLVLEFVPRGPQNPRVIEVAPRRPPSQERRPSLFSPRFSLDYQIWDLAQRHAPRKNCAASG